MADLIIAPSVSRREFTTRTPLVPSRAGVAATSAVISIEGFRYLFGRFVLRSGEAPRAASE
jgi:hypothetical protein